MRRSQHFPSAVVVLAAAHLLVRSNAACKVSFVTLCARARVLDSGRQLIRWAAGPVDTLDGRPAISGYHSRPVLTCLLGSGLNWLSSQLSTARLALVYTTATAHVFCDDGSPHDVPS